MEANRSRGLRAANFVVTPDQRPGWVLASERPLEIGETVFCAGGEGTLESLHGKTGDGSRLLEIRLPGERTRPFFAAASNVLVRPD